MVALLGNSSHRKRRIAKSSLHIMTRLSPWSLTRIFNRPKRTIYQSDEGYTITVEDHKRFFTQLEHIELARFLDQELLHDEYDIRSLSSIIIDDLGKNGEDGKWSILIQKSTKRFIGSILLNRGYLTTLDDLKETLAHEYGHHWSVINCILNHWPDFASSKEARKRRLPDFYYGLRGLDNTKYYPDYRGGWHLCDKEVIAEDYRVLFAPEPYNQEHAVIEKIKQEELPDYMIQAPSVTTKEFIANLHVPINRSQS